MLNSLAVIPANAAATIDQQKKVIAYLRGGSSFGPPYSANPWALIEGTDIGQFRQRPSAGQDAVTYAPLTVQLGAGLGDISQRATAHRGASGTKLWDATDPVYSVYKAAPGRRGRRSSWLRPTMAWSTYSTPAPCLRSRHPLSCRAVAPNCSRSSREGCSAASRERRQPRT